MCLQHIELLNGGRGVNARLEGETGEEREEGEAMNRRMEEDNRRGGRREQVKRK